MNFKNIFSDLKSFHQVQLIFPWLVHCSMLMSEIWASLSTNSQTDMETSSPCLWAPSQWSYSTTLRPSRSALRRWSSLVDLETSLELSFKKARLESQPRRENIGNLRENSCWLISIISQVLIIFILLLLKHSVSPGDGVKALEDVVLDEVVDLKMWLQKREGEALALSYKVNIGILNVLWSVTCGRKLHSQQQEFQAVYECIDKITQVHHHLHHTFVLISHLSSCLVLPSSHFFQSSLRSCLSQSQTLSVEDTTG